MTLQHDINMTQQVHAMLLLSCHERVHVSFAASADAHIQGLVAHIGD